MNSEADTATVGYQLAAGRGAGEGGGNPEYQSLYTVPIKFQPCLWLSQWEAKHFAGKKV